MKPDYLAIGVLIGVLPTIARADIIGVPTGEANGNGAFTSIVVTDSTSPFAEVDVSKRYDSIGNMVLEIIVDSDGRYDVNELITNNTGTAWSGFEWQLSGQTDGDFFIGISTNTAPFPDLSFAPPNGLLISGGTLANGAVLDTFVVLEVENSSAGGTFSFTQTPMAVPEPSCVALLSVCLIGLAGHRKRGRWNKR